MKRAIRIAAVGSGLVALSACVVAPSTPRYQALPGSRMSYEQFRYDDAQCREVAFAQSGWRGPAEAAQESAVASTVLGTVLGAVAGAAIGGNSNSAGVGAGIGMLAGASAGVGAADSSYHLTQRSFEAAYYPCMYARGHKVPSSGVGRSASYAQPSYAQPSYAPPPPPSSGAYQPPYWSGRNIPPPDAPPPR